MSPEMSRACARVKLALNLEEDSPQMAQLLAAAKKSNRLDDLPKWAQAVLHYANSQDK